MQSKYTNIRKRSISDEDSESKRQCRGPEPCNSEFEYYAPVKFSELRCQRWFDQYTDGTQQTQLQPQQVEVFYADIGITVDSVDMLLLSWKLTAATMGYITKEEWMRGLASLEADNSVQLNQQLQCLKHKVFNEHEQFKQFYSYIFKFIREPGKRYVEVNVVTTILHLIFDYHTPHIRSLIQFLNEKQTVKVINQDQWNTILPFICSISEDFTNYHTNDAWPVLLDEYVMWQLKNK
ncbi:Cullin binding-domain-containing protein [Syncephalis fuscata]|nr:Cullin binding-domain-containing protein [Syncephalis fuscata]